MLAEQPSTPREFKPFLLFAWSYRWLSSSPLGHFLSLERKTMKRDMSFFSGHVYSRTQCYYQGRIESSGLSSAALGDGFQLSWSNTQREKNKKHQKNLAQISYKLSLKSFLNHFWLQNYDILVYERRCVRSSAKKIASDVWNLAGRNVSTRLGAKRLNRALTIRILILLSRPALSSSSKKECG